MYSRQAGRAIDLPYPSHPGDYHVTKKWPFSLNLTLLTWTYNGFVALICIACPHPQIAVAQREVLDV